MTDHTSLQNKDAILFASRASQLLQQKKMEEALNLCEAGIRKFPFYPAGHYTLGLCYEALGKQEDAKNEFERTLVYDPAHNKAMRKLSEFYRKSGLDHVANELLVKEALYSPLNPEIINILKEKDLYQHLNPENGDTATEADEAVAEAEFEDTGSLEQDDVQNFDEMKEESELVEETISDEEAALIDTLDPLAGEDLEQEKMIIDNPQGPPLEDDIANTDDIHERDDFSPLMQGYLDKDDFEEDEDDDEEQWMEVENLLNGEEEISRSDVDPVPEGPKDETEMLLEQLSSDEDDGIDLEAGVIDPYDHIDLTSETDKSKIAADELSHNDLTAGIDDPFNKKEVAKQNQDIPANQQIETEDGESISEIVSEFEKQDDTLLEETETDELLAESLSDFGLIEETDEREIAESDADVDEVSHVQDDAGSETKESQNIVSEAEDEVTIRDMLENPNLVTPTFGEILIAQHKFSEARHVFVELSKKEPENTRFIKKIQFLDKFLQAER